MIKSAGFTLVSKLLTALLNFAAIIIVSRFLGPVDRGICGWYLVVIATSLVFSELAAGPAAGFLLRKYSVTSVRKISYLWSILTAISISSFFWMVKKINVQEWTILTVLCWLNAANTIHLHLFLAKQRLLLFNGLNLVLSAASVCIVFILFKSGHTSRIFYLYSLALAWGISFFIGLFLFKKDTTFPKDIASTGQLLKDGFTYGMANQVGHLTSLLNNRLVFFLLPGAVLGVYSNALSLAEAILMIPGSMGQILYAVALNTTDKKKSGETARIAWWLSLILLVFIFCVLLIVPDIFYQYVFGTEFKGVKNFLVILAGGMVFYGGYLIMSYWQSANGQFIKNFYASAIGLFVNVTVSITFLVFQKFDSVLGAVSLGVGFFIIFFVSCIQFHKENPGAESLLKPPSLGEFQRFLRQG